jgi:hypothetical protein
MTATATTATTATELRERAAAHDAAAQASYERCDTDGALSQRAHGLNAHKDLLQAQIVEAGGTARFVALFDLEGNLVPAKWIQTGEGRMVFGLLDPVTLRGRFIGWFNPSQAAKAATARRNDAKKGYTIGYVAAPARAELRGGNIACVMAQAVRTDGGFSPDVQILDNGQSEGGSSYYRDL